MPGFPYRFRRTAAPSVSLALAAVLALAAPPAAVANDSVANLAAGGLVLSRTDAVEMAAEDLFVSTAEIRVSYRFVNRTDADVTTLVAFPLPDISAPADDNNIVIPEPDAATNFLDFKTTVDGKPVAMQVEQRALALGIDRTDLLNSLSIPVAPHIPAAAAALDALPAATQAQLAALGMIAWDEYDIGKGMERHARPLWVAHTTYYWQQTFPANGEVMVEHRYTPSVGASAQSVVGTDFASAQDMQDYTERYCMDPGFIRAAKAMQQQTKTGTKIASEQRIDYILMTGANWAGAIGTFHLTVDKGDAQNLVSFCMDGVRKVSPTRFEATATDFWPQRDLAVLLLVPIALP